MLPTFVLITANTEHTLETRESLRANREKLASGIVAEIARIHLGRVTFDAELYPGNANSENTTERSHLGVKFLQ